MKICGTCKLNLEDSEFNKKKDKLQSQCKECNKKRLKEDYKFNKERYLKKSYKNRNLYSKSLDDYKKTLSCYDCGINFKDCWWLCDFHHKDPTQKDFNISYKRGNSLLDNYIEELKKCEPLCSNCHRTRHHNERNGS